MDGYAFDYRLGYIRDNCVLQGFDLIGADRGGNSRIVTLGGYTTPEQARNGTAWADELYKRTAGKYQILNGCTDGYSSAQILTVFIREVILLAPKLVVCLSGFHNIAYKLGLIQEKTDAELLKAHPFTTPGHLWFYRKITSRFGMGNGEVFYGTENYLPAWEFWFRQMAEIKYLCDEFNMGFKSLLQPCVFSGKYRRNARENAFLRTYYGISDKEISAYHEAFQIEYMKILEAADEQGYIVDLSGVFDSCEDVYTDAYHVKSAFLGQLLSNSLLVV